MSSNWLLNFTSQGLSIMATLFVMVMGIAFISVVIMYFIDKWQSQDAVRHNYPVIGRFRTFFITLGEFFRQYFFAMDREEMPFNRAEREWVARSSEGHGNTVAFGSTRSLSAPGSVIFMNTAFPTLDQEAHPAPPITFGPFCKQPYKTASLINISGMSYGAISKPAVKALAKGAALANCWVNTGEGGLSPYHLEGSGDVVFQIGTAKYGVRNEEGGLSEAKLRQVAAHPEVKMFEIKLSQGAKPGKGGILPAIKITEEIARIRGIPMGKDSVSPNRHEDIANISDLLDKMEEIRTITGKPVGFKTVIGDWLWLEDMFRLIKERGAETAPDFITIDSGDGGTGAAPMALMDNMGMLIKEALPRVVDLRDQYGYKDRVRIIASGKLITPAEVAWAFCAGADVVVSARGFMFALGCIQSLKCNKNTCPTGIATHREDLQDGLNPENKAQRVKNYVKQLHKEVELIAHSAGVPHPRALSRGHCRIIIGGGTSTPMDELYPPIKRAARSLH